MWRRVTSFAVALVAVSTPVQAQASASLSTVLTRLGAHIADYAARLPAAIASEHYRQWVRYPEAQVLLESDYGIMRLPGLAAWLGFRDVLSVNGKALPDRERRLASLFLHPSADAIQQARRIALESARFNLGPITRTINDPALVLELLDARNANRMRFVKAGEETIDGGCSGSATLGSRPLFARRGARISRRLGVPGSIRSRGICTAPR